jgi:hypothetical protein
MKDIIEICGEFGIEIPTEKQADFRKAVAGSYKTNAEHEKVLTKLQAATTRAETAETALKGFEGVKPEDLKSQLEEANKKVREAQEAAQKQLEERDFNDALKAAMDGIKFTSAAARKAVEAEVRANCTRVKDGVIIGLADVIASARKADAAAFVDEKAEAAEASKAKFAAPNKTPGGTPMTREQIMSIPDRAERRAAMAQNQHLFKEN